MIQFIRCLFVQYILIMNGWKINTVPFYESYLVIDLIMCIINNYLLKCTTLKKTLIDFGRGDKAWDWFYFLKKSTFFISDDLIRIFFQFMHHKCQLFHNENKTYQYFCIDKVNWFSRGLYNPVKQDLFFIYRKKIRHMRISDK